VSTNSGTVGLYLAAATTDDDETLVAVRASLADDIRIHGPLGDGIGPDAVHRVTGRGPTGRVNMERSSDQ
jgi:hypothetical protein